jgi:hypothetical protein
MRGSTNGFLRFSAKKNRKQLSSLLGSVLKRGLSHWRQAVLIHTGSIFLASNIATPVVFIFNLFGGGVARFWNKVIPNFLFIESFD